MSDAAPGSFPEGWQLGAESWKFHRQFFARVGRPAAPFEFSAIAAQIRFHRAEQLDRYHYRVVLSDGSPLVVVGDYRVLHGVEPADWVPKVRKHKAMKAKPGAVVASAASVAPVAPAVVAAPAPRRPLGANTLTLGSPAASRALAERLRRMGIPAEQASP